MKNERDLRLLVTKACNYRCQFCHEEGLPMQVKSMFTPQDYEFFYRIMHLDMGFRSVTFTGGEPLLRNDLDEICINLYNIGCKITLTTNGYLLGEKSSLGKYLQKVNISLHTLNREKYEEIVQCEGAFLKFNESLKKFRQDNPDTKIVFNATVVKGMNDSIEELAQIVQFAKKYDASIKFIELFPSSDKKCISINTLKEMLSKLNFKELKSDHRIKVLYDSDIYITLTKIFCEVQKDAHSENMCKQFNDLFISPDGQIKPCRNKDYLISIIDEVKNRDVIGLKNKVQECINVMGDNCKMQLAKYAG